MTHRDELARKVSDALKTLTRMLAAAVVEAGSRTVEHIKFDSRLDDDGNALNMSASVQLASGEMIRRFARMRVGEDDDD